jgi:hypothetical protein
MALPSILTDKNFLHFTHLLGANPREALSYLDYAWLLMNISGDPTFLDAKHVEGVLHWDAPKGHLVKAMLKTGFLKRKGEKGYILGDWEAHLYDWGKKRLHRKQEAESNAAAERRRSAPKRRPTDPDSDSLPKKGKIITFDPDPQPGQNRNRRNTPPKAEASPPKNPQQAALDAVRAVSSSLNAVGGHPHHPKAPKATQPIGTYTARDCALKAASLDVDHDPQTAQAMWTTRAAEVSQCSGGLEYFRDLLATLENASIPGNPKGVGKIHHAGRWLNAKTHQFLEQRRTA